MASRPVRKQSQHWSKDEDRQLGRSYIRVSEDPAGKGSDQDKSTLWEGIRNDFTKNAPPFRRDRAGELYAERTANALKIKWGKIGSDCLFWVSSLAFSRINHQSGEQREGDTTKARQFFCSRRNGKGFEYEDVYNIIKGSHKWQLDVAQHERGVEKRTEMGEKSQNKINLAVCAEEEESEGERPLGRDSARKAKKQTSAAHKAEEKADAKIDAYLEKITQKAAAASAYKTEVEAEIMTKDLSVMNLQQKEWYTRKRDNILRALREADDKLAKVVVGVEASATPLEETLPEIVPPPQDAPPMSPPANGFASFEEERAWIRGHAGPLFPEESTERSGHTSGQGVGAFVDLQEGDTESEELASENEHEHE